MGVRVNRADALGRIAEHLPAGWKPSPAPIVERLYSLVIGGEAKRPGVRHFSLLYGDIDKLARTHDAEQVFEQFESNLRLFVAEWARRRVFVHAGVVAWRGQAVLVPGRTHTGKTTLVAELIRAGATYYSDEFAVLDERGRVHPYAKPLAVREGESAKQKNYGVDFFGGTSGVKPLPVALVVASQYKAGARWRPRALSAGQGMLALLDNTVSARREPERALSVLQQVVARARVLKGVRGEAHETAKAILDLLNRSEGEG
ncbi:MAG: hypothetical protein LC754_06635 [Acidobacteria bacterium]|nr:hypothetical protein [Acidobacteriota bacterium]